MIDLTEIKDRKRILSKGQRGQIMMTSFFSGREERKQLNATKQFKYVLEHFMPCILVSKEEENFTI